MNKYLLICASLTWFSVLFSEQMSSSMSFAYQQRDKDNPNHIYFGPEFFCYDLNVHVNHVDVSDTKCFWGLRLGYEYLKPNAFYGGLEVFSAGNCDGFRAYMQGNRLPKQSGPTGFGNIELRLGYTAGVDRWLLSPFVGLGGYSVGQTHDMGFQQRMAYVAGGIRSQAEVNNNLNIGINLKVFRTYSTTRKFTIGCATCREDHNMWGGEIGVPFIWRMGSAKRWDAQLEPYFLKFQFSERQNLYGLRLLFGYHF
jgi:hypothetical protein